MKATPSEERSELDPFLPETTPNIHNIGRLRADLWNRLRDFSRRLRRSDELDAASVEGLRRQLDTVFASLGAFEHFHAFPGPQILRHLGELYARGASSAEELANAAVRTARLRTTGAYRKIDLTLLQANDFLDLVARDATSSEVPACKERPYFEVLLVDDISEADEAQVRRQLRAFRGATDEFIFELVVVRSLEDALLAVVTNPAIQAAVLRFSFPVGESPHRSMMDAIYTMLGEERHSLARLMPGERTARLGAMLRALRRELDVYRITDAPLEVAIAADEECAFRRHFYQTEDYLDLHVSLLKGIHDRYETPFFDALRRYSEKPTGMFHALPVSRGRTIAKSNWIKDFGDFYGPKLFLAETSATTGGLDSLLQPTGSLKRAQELAARAFGAEHTFFVTNGTSTANKIVLQALVRPGDIVLVSHDCHKSHPYGVILAGASLVYLDPYPLTPYSMYGGVTIASIKAQLLALRDAGKLAKVRLLLLTNLTFDGITYDPYRVMKEVLAIKPDIVFVWDEAWFAYGRFSTLLRRRTAVDAARRLDRELRSDAYRAQYAAAKASLRSGKKSGGANSVEMEKEKRGNAGTAAAQTPPGLPDPDLARVRVYATQSTHKTLTALRQGSMIHVHDTEFERGVEEVFHEAYMTHTSTSPNYQILASLDVGRRQVELEGSEMVGESIELALTLRERITVDPLLQRWFSVLGPKDMVPAEHRPSAIDRYWDEQTGLGPVETAWRSDEFVLDPTRVTVCVGRTGLDGDSFKQLLMDRYDIHINKTSRNTVLFLVHIGMSRGTIAHLVKVLRDIAMERDRWFEHASVPERVAAEGRVRSLMTDVPPLPNFSRFHASFLAAPGTTSAALPHAAPTPEGDMRAAFFKAYDSEACEFVPLDAALLGRLKRGPELVSASFLTPYPPGFPVLVPGQVLSEEIVRFLLALDVKEIHGLDPLGIRVFRDDALPLPQPNSPARPVATEPAQAPLGAES
jgi:arginine decarboxylase